MEHAIFCFIVFISSLLSFTSPVFAAPVAEPRGYAPLGGLETVFGNLITVVAIIGGFLAFFALIVGGFRYITAQGDPKAIASARSTITWAIVGLALIIIAWLILVFIQEFTGIRVTRFTIPGPTTRFP